MLPQSKLTRILFAATRGYAATRLHGHDVKTSKIDSPLKSGEILVEWGIKKLIMWGREFLKTLEREKLQKLKDENFPKQPYEKLSKSKM